MELGSRNHHHRPKPAEVDVVLLELAQSVLLTLEFDESRDRFVVLDRTLAEDGATVPEPVCPTGTRELSFGSL